MQLLLGPVHKRHAETAPAQLREVLRSLAFLEAPLAVRERRRARTHMSLAVLTHVRGH